MDTTQGGCQSNIQGHPAQHRGLGAPRIMGSNFDKIRHILLSPLFCGLEQVFIQTVEQQFYLTECRLLQQGLMGIASSGNLIISHNLSLSNLLTCGTGYLFMQIRSHN